MIATSANRVAEQTSELLNEQIRRSTDMNIAYFAVHPEEIDDRLDELDQEWDIERALAMTSSSLSILGCVLGIVGRRRWLVLPVVVQGFFLQHAIQGWCPPLPLLRRMGFRTQAEIEAERYALKAIKGDFSDIPGDDDSNAESRAEKILSAIRGESMRRMGNDSNRRPMRSENPGPQSKPSSRTKEDSLGMDDNELPRSDVGPTS